MAKLKLSVVNTASEIANHQFDSSEYISLSSISTLRKSNAADGVAKAVKEVEKLKVKAKT